MDPITEPVVPADPAVAAKEHETKMLACKDEIQAVLLKYGCTMRVGAPNIEIIPSA